MFTPLLVLALWSAPPAERVELIFGGDIIPHGGVKTAAEDHALRGPGGGSPSLNHEGWDHVFEPVAEVLRSADLAVVNLETPISGDRRARLGEILFDAPPALAQALAGAGVDAVSIANNHALDQHREGIQATWAHLAAAGVRPMGSGPSEAAAWEPLVFEVRGVRVGLLSLTRWLNEFRNPPLPDTSPQVAYVPYLPKPGTWQRVPQAVELVRAAARRCDALIVSVHWGIEYSHTPRPEDREFAHALLEAGALAIVGHHPHVLQPLERYRTASGRDTLVAYSLGNLVANQDWGYVHGAKAEAHGRKRDSVLLRLALARSTPGAPVALEGLDVLPVWIDNHRLRVAGARRVTHQLQPVLLDAELAALPSRLQELPPHRRAEPPQVRQERNALERRLDLVRRRRDLILRIVLPAEARAAQRPL